jgi:hypothetical protein
MSATSPAQINEGIPEFAKLTPVNFAKLQSYLKRNGEKGIPVLRRGKEFSCEPQFFKERTKGDQTYKYGLEFSINHEEDLRVLGDLAEEFIRIDQYGIESVGFNKNITKYEIVHTSIFVLNKQTGQLLLGKHRFFDATWREATDALNELLEDRLPKTLKIKRKRNRGRRRRKTQSK